MLVIIQRTAFWILSSGKCFEAEALLDGWLFPSEFAEETPSICRLAIGRCSGGSSCHFSIGSLFCLIFGNFGDMSCRVEGIVGGAGPDTARSVASVHLSLTTRLSSVCAIFKLILPGRAAPRCCLPSSLSGAKPCLSERWKRKR